MLRSSHSALVGLFIVVTASSALGVTANPHRVRGKVLSLDLPPVSVTFASIPVSVLSVEPRKPKPTAGLGTSSHRCACRWIHPYRFEFPERKTRLSDPMTALGAAFRKCRAIRADLLDPMVRAARYPEGHFGDWVHEGVLVTHRIEITDEATLRQLFALLGEAIGAPDEPIEYWAEETEPETTADDYRRDNGLLPDLVFEFVGEHSLRIEVSLSQARVLIQAGDKWEGYELDRWSAAALKELVAPTAGTGKTAT